MTVYIFGGSNTAMKGGWADGLVARLCRRMSVQNLGLGATNSLNAMIRLQSDVSLQPGDVVVWPNAINDAICIGSSNHTPARFMEYVETMIRTCRKAGARFVPVLLDTFRRDLMIQQAAYARCIDALTKHYDLDVVHLPASFAAKYGTAHIPRRHFWDVLHLVPGGEVCEFVADLAADLIDEGRGYPADRAPLFCSNDLRFELLNNFGPKERRERFRNLLLDTKVWNPPISLQPEVPQEGHCEIEAVTLIADVHDGRFTMRVGKRTLPLSANHNFTMSGRPIALTACARVIDPNGVPLLPGQQIQFDWATGSDPLPVDMYFRPQPAGPHVGSREARVISVLLRHQQKVPPMPVPNGLGAEFKAPRRFNL